MRTGERRKDREQHENRGTEEGSGNNRITWEQQEIVCRRSGVNYK